MAFWSDQYTCFHVSAVVRYNFSFFSSLSFCLNKMKLFVNILYPHQEFIPKQEMIWPLNTGHGQGKLPLVDPALSRMALDRLISGHP